MRSVQTVRSTQSQWVGAVSACIAIAGTSADSLMLSLLLSFSLPLSCLPSLGAALLSALFRLLLQCLGSRVRPPARRRFPGRLALFCSSALRYYEGSDSCYASPREQVSPLISRTLPGVPPPTTWVTRISLCTPMSAYPMRFRLRHLLAGSPSLPAESSSSPADRQFASGCSPPHLTMTQLPSATESWLYSDTDSHRAVCAPSRAH